MFVGVNHHLVSAIYCTYGAQAKRRAEQGFDMVRMHQAYSFDTSRLFFFADQRYL